MTNAPRTLAPDSASLLLGIARDAIRGGLAGEPLPRPTVQDIELGEHRGAFVTLRSPGGRLRGCIGRVESPWPLWETVARMARASAFGDPRFAPLSPDELDGIHVEVSVLSTPVPVNEPDEVQPGEHGVMVEQGVSRGLFLPQVATEQGWGREELLDQACIKAGIAPDAWRGPDVTIYVFTAEVIAEREDRTRAG